jgi:S-adenosylmethionine decarboxylase proenzyme
MKSLGKHAIIDYYECNPQILSSAEQIREILISAVRQAGLHVVLDNFHHFSPHGVSGVVVIAESHVTIHTWPEHGFAAVDVFICGETKQSERIQTAVQDALKSARMERRTFDRGCGAEARILGRVS